MSFFRLTCALCLVYWAASNAAFSIAAPEIVWSGEYLDPAFAAVGVLLALVLWHRRHPLWLGIVGVAVPFVGSAIVYFTNVAALGPELSAGEASQYLRSAWLAGVITAIAALLFKRLSLVGPPRRSD